MAGTALTTQEVARLLSVSEATIKRWADDGLIYSEKTAGGHRRFGLAEVARFQRERGGAHTPQNPNHAAAKAKSAEKISPGLLFERLAAGDEDGTSALLISSYLHGQNLASLFDRVITPTMHRVGDLWCRGEMTVADEHLATQTIIAALQKLRSVIHLSPPTETSALVCGIEGDLHELPVHLAHSLLEAEGWGVINLGPNTPLFTIVEALAKHRPQMLCISAKLILDPDRLVRDYAQVRKAAAKPYCAIVMGGSGLEDRSLRQRFPSEFYAANFEQLRGFARRMLSKPGSK